jgi:hypothetical protein
MCPATPGMSASARSMAHLGIAPCCPPGWIRTSAPTAWVAWSRCEADQVQV